MMVGSQLTGRKVFLIVILAFSTVIAVNATLVVKALKTYPGLDVKNSYVASQKFERERQAQLKLGWHARAFHENGRILIEIKDAQGEIMRPKSISAVLMRPTTKSYDVDLELSPVDSGYQAQIEITDENWLINLEAIAEDDTVFKQRLVLKGRE